MESIYFNDIENSHIADILKEMYLDKIYRPYLMGKSDLTILDIGANIGIFSLFAKDYAKKIYAVEPTPAHIECLKTMIEYNKLSDKVTVIEKAIALKDGKATFKLLENSTANSLSDAFVPFSKGTIEVETITLDTLFTQNKIEHVDFMKLDVEGVESEILGSSAFDKVADKIDALVVEWHTWSNRNPSQLVTALLDNGFQVTRLPGEATLFGATRL